MAFRLLTIQVVLLSTLLPPRDATIGKRSLYEKCIPDLGCFNNGGKFFHWLYRPIALLPDDREFINTTFLLYTRRNPTAPQVLRASDPAGIRASNFKPDSSTKFLIHGFMDSIKLGKWIYKMRDQFFKMADDNVIVVDWSGGNVIPYTRATANSRVVGAEVAHLIRTLEKVTGAKQDKFHLIGHSLGAQIAGYAGERLRKLGRISGLDPAGPYFYHMPPEVRLDPTDAKFVDVIHSDASLPFLLFVGLGIDQMVGHLDFYPNNGNNQPGCQKTHLRKFLQEEGPTDGIRRFTSCDHIRSLDFYLASMNLEQSCLPVGVSCPTWNDFVAGKCPGCGPGKGACAVMGYFSDKLQFIPKNETRSKMFLKTSGDPPYCMHQYQVAVKMSKTPKRSSWDAFGQMYLHLKGKIHEGMVRLSKRPQEIRSGGQYRYLLSTTERLHASDTLSLLWNNNDRQVRSRLFVHSVQLEPFDGFFVQDNELKYNTFCGNKSHALAPGEEMMLLGNSTCSDY